MVFLLFLITTAWKSKSSFNSADEMGGLSGEGYKTDISRSVTHPQSLPSQGLSNLTKSLYVLCSMNEFARQILLGGFSKAWHFWSPSRRLVIHVWWLMVDSFLLERPQSQRTELCSGCGFIQALIVIMARLMIWLSVTDLRGGWWCHQADYAYVCVELACGEWFSCKV